MDATSISQMNSPQHRPTMFNTRSAHISGGEFILNYIAQSGIPAGIENSLLEQYVVPSATHDTNDVSNPPQCYPGTRIALLNRLSNWFKDTGTNSDGSPSPRIIWLFGPAGAGKSAITQTLAEELSVAGHLIASFFFCRMDARRSTDKALVATMAYQIARHPSTPKRLQQNIASVVLKDPMILCRSLRTQFEKLIVNPINDNETDATFVASRLYRAPALILIDGLDECEDRDARTRILDTIFHVVPRLGNNFKFLISSRPEDDIRRLFERSNIRNQIEALQLLADSQAYDDVRFYLHDGLSQLKVTHPIGETLDSEWPSSKAIEVLVHKSSGHFIYAHTMLKYIDSPRYRPQDCLNVVLSLQATIEHNPYAELDALYHDILSSSRADRKTLNQILSFSLVCIRAGEISAGLDVFIESLLSLERGTVKLALLDLSSVISLQKSPWSAVLSGCSAWSIKFEHKSFVDFLMNSSRSREFYVDLQESCMSVARTCLKALNDTTHLTKFWPMDTKQKHMLDESIKFAYQRVLTWCCRHIDTLPDPELRRKLLDHDVLRALPPGAVMYGKSFDVFLDFLDALKEGPAFRDAKHVFQNHLSVFDQYLKCELDHWVTIQPRLMILLSMFIFRSGIKWTRLIESQPRQSLKSILEPSLNYACESTASGVVSLPHFLVWFLDGRIASFASSSDVFSKFVSDFFYSEERAGKYYLGRKAYRWLTI